MGRRELGDLTAACIRCGFCLESCPTFRLSGDEVESPRGRINLVRACAEGQADWSEARHALDTCLGCRACETACPSGVRYGEILEQARAHQAPNPAQALFLEVLTRPGLLRMAASLAPPRMPKGILSPEPTEADVPRLPNRPDWPPLEESLLPPIRGEVAILRGCAMSVYYDDVNEATVRLLRRVGYRVVAAPALCCGALHAHAGRAEAAAQRLRDLEAALPNVPLIVNSAGCGSHLKDAGCGARVKEATTFLWENDLPSALTSAPGLPGYGLTYHDACHLAHGLGVRQPPRQLLSSIPGVRFVELAESDTCCGSAGIYNLTQPRRARALLDRKWDHVRQTGAQIVATGNPGCLAWIAQAAREAGSPIEVRHTLDVLESAFCGLRPLF